MTSALRITFSFLLLSFSTSISAQVIDEIRLSYEPEKLKADQLAAAATPDGKILAFCFSDGNVKVFDTRSQKYRSSFKVAFEKLFDFQVTTNGLVTLISGKDLLIHDWQTGKELKKLPLGNLSVRTQYHAGTNQLFIGQAGKIVIIDLNKMEETGSLKTGGINIQGMSVNPAATRIAFSAGAGPLNLFKVVDLQTGQTIVSQKKMFPVFSISYGSDGRLLTTEMGKPKGGLMSGMSGPSGGIQYTIHDPAGKEISSFMLPIAGKTLNTFECVLDGNKALFSNPDYSINVVDLDTRQHAYVSRPDKNSFLANSDYTSAANIRTIPLNNGRYLFTFGDHNLMRIYDAATSQVTGYFFTDGGSGFCTVSRDGRIDGDMSSLSSVFWTSRKSSQRTSLERTFERGYTPRLFNLLINGTDQQTAQDFDMDKESAAQTTVSISAVDGKAVATGATINSVTKKINLTMRVSGATAGKTLLKVSHNGKVVRTLAISGASEYSTDLSLTTSFGSANYIAAYAEENGISSEKSKLIVEYSGASDEQPKLFLVTIGINNYRNTKYNLNYAQADADGIATTISSLPKGLFSSVINHSIRNDKAVKANILQTFREIKSIAKEQDMLVVYYAGHGIVSDDEKGNSDFYLALHDLTQLYGRADQLADKAMSATEIKTLAQEINAQKQVFLLDACQSAGALEAAAKRGVAEERAIAQLARSTGTFWITASGSSQFATEFEQLGHGVFTYALLEGLKGKADINKDNNLTIRELSVYIEDQVPLLTEQYKGTAQYPSSYSFGNDFPLTVLPK